MEEGRSDGSNEGSDGEYPDVNIDENCSDMKRMRERARVNTQGLVD